MGFIVSRFVTFFPGVFGHLTGKLLGLVKLLSEDEVTLVVLGVVARDKADLDVVGAWNSGSGLWIKDHGVEVGA